MQLNNPIFDSLNEEQCAAVAQIHGPLLILAGPGSGKTRVITHRIANMIANDIPSYNIVALTFTNKAADEMRKRLENLAPDNQTWTGTFHRFCSRLLRNYADQVGLQQNFTIYDASDSKKVVKQAIENSQVDPKHYTPDRLMNEISKIKNAAVTVEQFQPRPGHVLDTIMAKVYPEYQKLLQLSNGVDFDDLLLHTVDLLRQSPELRESLDRRYAYMMVDEYQDTNSAQYQLIRLLNFNTQNLAVTGDPDQSIYGWRGANLNNILHFERDYPELKIVRLEQNYRSTKSVLQVADQLISNNRRRKEKSLHTENEAGRPVRLVTYFEPKDEATNIADSMSLAIRKGDRSPSDYAILYRTNYLSRSLEHALRRSNLPYQIVRGHEFYQRAEIKDVIGYLHLLNNPSDGVAFERVVNVPPRKIGKVTLGRLRAFANSRGISMIEAARSCDQISAISPAPTSKITQFVQMIDELAKIPTEEVEPVIRAVLAKTGYRDWLTLDGSEEGYERAKNVDELIVAAQEFDRDFEDDGGLERYLEQAALVSDTDAFNSSAEYVTLMSLHAAKGLEFPCVYIVGLEEGILPHERSAVDEEQIEEERRLLFVGITRAEEELQISRCLNRFRRGSHWPVIPSRFLMELPRSEMEVFEPSAQSRFRDDGFGDFSDGFDPRQEEELPSIDIKTDHEPVKTVDQAEDQNFDRFDLGETNVVRESKIPGLAKIMTGAQLAEELQANAQPRLEPDSYSIGMDVEHTQYGVGQVVTLTGKGTKRTATVEFPSYGKKSFRVAFCNMRSV